MMKYFAEIRGVFITNASCNVSQTRIWVLANELHRGINTALGQIGISGYVAVFPKQ